MSTVELPNAPPPRFGHFTGMQSLPDILARIDLRLAKLKLSDAAASKRAGKPDAIRNARRALNAPDRKGITFDTLQALAGALETTVAWLADGVGPADSDEVTPANAEILAPLADAPMRSGARDLPKLGVAVGGSEGDFRFNGERQDYLPRPPGLIGRKKAFAVTLRNDSMWPAYHDGWTIYVDPDGPKPVAGDTVLVELYPEIEGEPGAAFVKTLVSRSGTKVIVSQFNPPKDIPFDADNVKQILRVIPYVELMGI
jgi:phage repressor protein C with HTH and peptisase S24 domain